MHINITLCNVFSAPSPMVNFLPSCPLLCINIIIYLSFCCYVADLKFAQSVCCLLTSTPNPALNSMEKISQLNIAKHLISKERDSICNSEEQ